MVIFENNQSFSYEIKREGDEAILQVNMESYPNIPSIEEDPILMSKVIDILLEVENITKIVLVQKRDYEYDYTQTGYLNEIAKVYTEIIQNKQVLDFGNIAANPISSRYLTPNYTQLRSIISNSLKSDPIGVYVELRRLLREEKIKMEKSVDSNLSQCHQKLIGVQNYIISLLDRTKMVSLVKPYLSGYKVGDREVYSTIFKPLIRPDFMFTKLMATSPDDAEKLDSYMVKDTDVTIFQLSDSIHYLYHIVPPEFKLNEDQYELLDNARKTLSEHKPKRSEFVNPERMREVFFNIGHDMIEELAENRDFKLRQKEVNQLAEILVRYTVGFGLIEVLLQDEKIQDITMNSPMGETPIFIVHQDFDDCRTNIIPVTSEAESWASKLRLISGRPLDEANPILDTELELPGASTRVAVITQPLNPRGLAFALRRHRDKPWTLPLFIKNKMLNPLGAGILSFIIDGSRTVLVAGTRSAGKTSLLGGLMTEIMRKFRMITIEDTLELPVNSLRKLGYNIQPMKVASAMSKGTAEVSADDGIRTTLRLGDSCLIVGEVRSTEARALYEAMRVGALANVVAGTIHGDSPYGVYDRVVNDLNVPKTSFKATDIIIVTNPIRSADGLHRWRRITQITEVRKFWENDPLLEKGFVDLMKYETKTDQLEPSNDLINGDSDILKAIAGNVKEWAGNWDAVWDNITLRAKIKETLVNVSQKINNPDILEADFVMQANDQFHKISDIIKEEVGNLDSSRIFFDWNEWLKRTIKKKSFQ